ncbi:AAA family ATPase [Priestia megaterium]|uniref:AAA family ATPase n=1 Tax=Priestia megaterium TaxID=1404 RepID=UPI003459BA4D
MRIKSIYIDNLLGINNQTIVFPEPSFNYFGDLKFSIIVGENGTCKTSLLKFLAEVFMYPNIGGRHIQRYRNGFKIDYEIQGEEQYIEVGQISFNNSRHGISTNYSNLVPSNIIVSTTALNGKFSSSSKEVNNIRYIYTGPLKSQRAAIVKALRDNKLEKSIKKLIELVGYSTEYRIVMPDGEILRRMITKNERKIDFFNEKELEDFLRIHTEISSLHKNSKRRRVISDNKIDEFWLETIEKIMEVGVNLDFQLEIRNLAYNEWIDFKDMSSGEQAMFDRFFSLLTLIKDNSLVLIDEPETHLHPSWIKQYVFILSELFSHVKAHIIIATHSPLIAADVPNECIIGLVKCSETGSIKQYEVNKSTLGGNPTNILNDVFRIDNQAGSFANLIVERIKEHIRKGEVEKALDMFNDLGTTVNKYSLYNDLMELMPEEFK